MATLTKHEIEQLKQQLKEKQEEIKAIYDQLVEAGVVPIPDDFLDGVSGGRGTHQASHTTAFPPDYRR